MSTSANHPSGSTPLRVPLRVRLLDRRNDDEIDGIWWPQSRELQVEAADLIDHLPARTGYVNRLLFSRPDWDDALVDGRGARRIAARRGPVKVSFPDDDTHTMVLVLADGRRLRLQIVPSSASAAEATAELATLAGSADSTTTEPAWSRWDEATQV